MAPMRALALLALWARGYVVAPVGRPLRRATAAAWSRPGGPERTAGLPSRLSKRSDPQEVRNGSDYSCKISEISLS